MTASATAKQLGIHVRAAQRWMKQYEYNSVAIFVSKKQDRKCIFKEERKMTAIKHIDFNCSAAIVDITDHLINEFRPSDI